MGSSQDLIDKIFHLSADIRYVAVYTRGELAMASQEGRQGASSSSSDTYEELLVNPTVLTLTRQRGNIDCGGLAYVLIRYGNFFQLVMPLAEGHLSVCIEPHADPLALVGPIREVVQNQLDAR